MKSQLAVLPAAGFAGAVRHCSLSPGTVSLVSLAHGVVRTVSALPHASVSVGVPWALMAMFPPRLIGGSRPRHLGKELEVTAGLMRH